MRIAQLRIVQIFGKLILDLYLNTISVQAEVVYNSIFNSSCVALFILQKLSVVLGYKKC